MNLEKLIRLIKNDPNYKWEVKHSAYDLLIISYNRGKQVLRGLFVKPFFKVCKGLLFIGSNVKIMHKNYIRAGKNLIIEDKTYINALSYEGITFGDNVSIGRDSIIVCTGVVAHKGVGIKIGNGTGINSNACLQGQGGIEIGENVIIGPGIKIFSENHNYSDPNKLIKDQGVTRNGVVIKDNCWFGSSVSVLSGVTIGSGCVVATGSLVTQSFPDNVIIGGVPAKILKSRIE